jgi:hypothetical protein
MPDRDSAPTLIIGSIDISFAKYAVRRRFMGEWQIISMSEWDQDYVAISGPPTMKVSSSGYGTIRFGAFEGVLDAMTDELRPDDVMQFSFHGTDEGDEVCGRGFVIETGGTLRGRICFHRGLSSEFEATRVPKPTTSTKKSAKGRKPT